MTAEVLLLLILSAATLLAAGLGALILAAFGPMGWFVIGALILVAALAWRFALAQLAARSDWRGDDLRDEWRSG